VSSPHTSNLQAVFHKALNKIQIAAAASGISVQKAIFSLPYYLYQAF
jgi:hypothetical protein